MNESPVEHRTVALPVGRRGRCDVDVAYHVAGEGPPVVLLHGAGIDAADVSWRYAIPELARNHRVYALDLPGHGESDKPRRRYTTDFFRSVLEAFLDELGLNHATLVGVSMGGCIALGHALEYDVDRLVLVASYGLGGDTPWRPSAWAGLRIPFAHGTWWRSLAASKLSTRSHLNQLTAGAAPDDLVADVYRAIQDGGVGRAAASWQRSEFRASGLATDYRDRLAELDAETLLVHGGRDPLLPAEWSRAAAETIPNGELAVLDGAGHWAARERPEQFNGRVAEFL